MIKTIQLLLGIVIFFAGCKSPRANVEIDNSFQIPKVKFEALPSKGNSAFIMVNDSFSASDWPYWKELTFYLYGKGLIKNVQKYDSLCLEIHTPSQEGEYWNSVHNIKVESGRRKNSPIYFSFWEANVREKEFRLNLLHMSHVLGQLLEEDPEKRANYHGPYNAPILAFLFGVSINADEEKYDPIIEFILDSLVQRVKPYDTAFAASLEKFKW